MIKKILFVILMAPLMTINAQNWKPFNKIEKYNYFKGDVPYASIWVDSVDLINTDSVFFLNKVLKKVKDENILPYRKGYYLENRPQLFLAKHISHLNGDITMENDANTTYLIKPHTFLNNSWIFNVKTNNTATVVQQLTRTVFGNIDSVKIIALSSKDTIILSKNFGILKFPLFDALHQHIDLAGIEGRNVGVIIPKYTDFFDFNVGDIFYYTDTFDIPNSSCINHLKKITITTKRTAGDTTIYHAIYKSIEGSCSGGKAHIPWNNDDTVFRYINSSNDFLNKYSAQILDNNVEGETYKPVNVNFDNSFKTLTKSYIDHPFCKDSKYDTITEYSAPLFCSNRLISVRYGKQVGLMNSSYYWWQSGSNKGQVRISKLVGCIKNGVLFGSIIPDSLFLTIPVVNIKQFQFKIYPNPARNEITIDAQLDIKKAFLIIYNISGQALIKQQLVERKTKIDIGNLTTGIYYVKLINHKLVEVQKIIKE